MSDVNISAAIAGTKSEIDLAAFPDFPIQIFDPIIQELILVISSVIGAPASMAASAFIMLSAACIGRKRGLVIGSRIEHANMFMLHIGQSGTGKSPTMKTIFSELSRYELERYKEYVKELDLYNAQKKNKKNKQPLIEPLLKQVTTDDATTQALLRILHANPAGIMVKVDEVDGLFSNKKIEKKRLLTGYNVGEWRSNRVKNTNNYFIPAGAISILGLMTKETLIENVGPEDVRSGLVPRFCFILDNKVDLPDFSSDTIKDKDYQTINAITQNLLNFKFDSEQKPLIVRMTMEAEEIFKIWYNRQKEQPWLRLKKEYNIMIAKHYEHCLRFALNLDCLKKATNNSTSDEPITKEIIQSAIILSDYIKIQKEKIYNLIHGLDVIQKLNETQLEVAKALIKLCKPKDVNIITTAEITDQINRERHQIRKTDSSVVGRILSPLGLSKVRNNNGRSYEIRPQHITNIISRIKATEGDYL